MRLFEDKVWCVTKRKKTGVFAEGPIIKIVRMGVNFDDAKNIKRKLNYTRSDLEEKEIYYAANLINLKEVQDFIKRERGDKT
jgi:hypothetical protein